MKRGGCCWAVSTHSWHRSSWSWRDEPPSLHIYMPGASHFFYLSFFFVVCIFFFFFFFPSVSSKRLGIRGAVAWKIYNTTNASLRLPLLGYIGIFNLYSRRFRPTIVQLVNYGSARAQQIHFIPSIQRYAYLDCSWYYSATLAYIKNILCANVYGRIELGS